MQPFVRLEIGPGLYGVTKLRWRTWPMRTWLSWVLGAVFLVGAIALAWVTEDGPDPAVGWHQVLKWGALALLVAAVIFRLILEGTVSKPPPGQPPRWDKQLFDPWWSSIHTLTGVVLGLWLVPFAIAALLTVLWEVFEIAVPGFGDEEINGNRLFDLLLAWVGWFLAAGVVCWQLGLSLPIVW